MVDLGGRTTFAELATVLAAAEAVVVGNTGAAHLAVAVGTPVVSVYAPTVPASRWRPWRQPHVCSVTSRSPAPAAAPGSARSSVIRAWPA